MKKLSAKQFGRASEISGNISVAWFSAGAISPFLSRPNTLTELIITFSISLLMAGFFFGISLKLEGVKK